MEENRIASIANNSNDREKEAFEKGRKIGRLEGILYYQQHLIQNLQKDNQKVNLQLLEIDKK